jgi:hypothetical protein
MPKPVRLRVRKMEPERTARLLTNLKLMAVCFGLIWLGAVVRRPFLIAGRMAQDNQRLEERLLSLKLENQRLRRQAAVLETQAGMEREARRLGYLRQGEVPLIVP